MDVQALGLETGKAVGDGAKSSAYRFQVIEPFLEAKIAQIVGTKLIAQKAGELFILFEEGVLPVNPEDVMAALDLTDDGRQLSPQPLMKSGAKDLADAMGGDAPETDFTAAFEDLVNREVALEDKVPCIFDLCHGLEALDSSAYVPFWRTWAPGGKSSSLGVRG